MSTDTSSRRFSPDGAVSSPPLPPKRGERVGVRGRPSRHPGPPPHPRPLAPAKPGARGEPGLGACMTRDELRRRLRRRFGVRPRLGHDFPESVGRRVTDAERTTAAEVVVVVRPCSGNYRDVDFLFGAAVAWLTLLGILFSPVYIPPASVPVETAVVFAVAAWVCSVSLLRRWLT